MAAPANQRGWGPGWPKDRSADMVWVTAARSGVRWQVHRDIAPILRVIVNEVEARGYLFDHGPGDVNDDWGYANRAIRGSNRPSNHSWGLAIDFDAQEYPMGQRRRVPPAWVVDVFEHYGFTWGGRWTTRPDPMHMEWLGNRAQALQLTAMLAAGYQQSKPVPVPATVPPPLPINPTEDPVDHILICEGVGIVHVIDGLGSFVTLNELVMIRQRYKDAGVKLLEQNVSKTRLDQMMRR